MAKFLTKLYIKQDKLVTGLNYGLH